MANRMRHQITDYERTLRYYHKTSSRHVVVFEAEIPEDNKRHLFRQADLLRQCGNELLGIMKRRLEQLLRTKRYRGLRKYYGSLSEKLKALEKLKVLSAIQKKHRQELLAELKSAGDSMKEMQEDYQVTWDFCRKTMEHLRLSYGQPSIFALSRAEDVWSAVSKVLYSDGDSLHFRKRGQLPEMRAKQSNRGILIFLKNDHLCFRCNGMDLPIRCNENDLWLIDELDAIETYLRDPDTWDAYAVDQMQKGQKIVSTYRPCYASIVCKVIRGKLRIYIHLTVEGRSLPKRTKDGCVKHPCSDGVVGCDIGTQTIAYTSGHDVGLENLAERGQSIRHTERQQRLILRAMDRSRRATNPGNYNPDGTIRKGKKIWIKSNRYRKLQKRHQELCRIAAENRKFAIHEQVHKMRSLGNVFVTEAKNAKKLQRRAKPEDPLDKNGKPKRKKRFGKSIQNRCPGYFQMKVKQMFESTGGIYIEVPTDYRASQYDHTTDDYIKKKLSQRMFCLQDGTKVQRDWYSSFLLYCIDLTTKTIDRKKCKMEFESLLRKEQVMIEKIIRSGRQVMNSGIRIAQ